MLYQHKKVGGLLLAFVLILLSSCTTPEDYILEDRFRTDDLLPEFDMQTEYSISGGSLCRSGQVYYYYDVLHHFIYYYDEASQTSGKLCAKPDCTHDSRDCNAYSGGCLQIYDGKLYFMGDSGGMYRMDLTGGNREFVMVVRGLNGSDPKFYLHRGYVYSSVLSSNVVNGKASAEFTLCQQRLEQTETLKEITRKSFDGVAFHSWIIRGNELYLSLGALSADQQSVQNELYCYHIQTGELELLWSDTTDYFIYELYADSQELRFIQSPISASESCLSSFDLKQKTIRRLLPSEDPTMPAGCLAKDAVLWFSSSLLNTEGKPVRYQIMDLEGNELIEGSFPPATSNRRVLLSRLGADEHGFLFNLFNMEADIMQMLRIPYDAAEAQVLVSSR